MFSNTVYLAKDTAQTVEVSLIDGPTNRKTIRSSADGKTSLVIAHQESNENPGLATQRSTVRITSLKEIEDTGKSAQAYVQLTYSLPRDVFSVAEFEALLVMLLNFGAKGDNITDGDSGVIATASNCVVSPRLYAGEP